ncbi:NADH-ubiquinone oxidoreductase complex I, 21 kDa subunit-domain-containing protein [Leucosporidium creatinivorum]|uniref:NADH-ubiquinone oxidoreductase complex I, 21 kDa subunit-domain-containing protein n=1 Tax=Leucosporidium creatinivorum TaxID=106004 RepID=A0A1Y2EGU8_9BASI|nr:NADH-ubiquinone oxidoreductase complex I, 21 kDa subunit-domain-containing protein [Leucosporidium creatinivorum]
MSSTTKVNDLQTSYPLIDADPTASRVLSYMRPSDYALWAAGTAAAPGAIYAMELADPTKLGRAGLRPTLRLATFLGFAGGFLLAYQTSSLRFWGWKENAIEVERDQKELSALAKAGKPVYGESDLPEYVQGVAHRNSMWSQLKFGALPWFNLVNHKHHGVDVSKYSSDE